MSLRVNQVVSLLQQIAPPTLAESWDNVGLQIGDPNWKVRKICTALDPVLHVVKRACHENVNLLITHHPLFLKHLDRIDLNTTKGKIINLALHNHLAIFCAHTNLDSSIGGINDVLANKLNLIDIKPLKKEFHKNFYKLVLFAPLASETPILKVLASLDAGQIGTYSCCSFRNKGVGTFLPNKESTPYIGTQGSISEVEEIRIETIVNKENIENIITSIQKIHPYEIMPYDIYPIVTSLKSGIGRIGKLKKEISLSTFVQQIKNTLNLRIVKISGNLETLIKSVALCSGSGSSMVGQFLKSEAQVYVSGDITYHDALAAQEQGLTTIDLGHFNSERFAISNFTKRFEKMISAIDKNISIFTADFESDVFKFI